MKKDEVGPLWTDTEKCARFISEENREQNSMLRMISFI